MRSAYKFLAYAIDALILLQAAAMAWAVFGLANWIEDGNTLTKAKMEGDDASCFTEERGFMIHGINGQMLIPLIGLILLIISFFAKVPGGSKWAGHAVRRHRAPGGPRHLRPRRARPRLHPRVLGAAAVLAGLPHGQAGRRGDRRHHGT